jgi:hypothetical protein
MRILISLSLASRAMRGAAVRVPAGIVLREA